MQIAKQTPEILELRSKRLVWEYSIQQLSFLPLVLAGLIFILWAGNLATLNCHRIGNQSSALSNKTHPICQLKTLGLLGEKVTEIEHLKAAKIEYLDQDQSEQRVLLVTDRGTIPLTRASNSGGYSQSHRHVSKINTFIESSRESTLRIVEEDFLSSYPAGLVLLLFSCFIIFKKEPKSCIFDKNSCQFSIICKNMLLQIDQIEEELNSVDCAVRVFSKKRSTGEKYYKVNVKLKSGSTVYLALLQEPEAVEITDAINGFLETVQT